MTGPGQAAGAAQEAAGQTASVARDEATQVGHTATSAASDVAGTAKEQAGQVVGEAVNQVRQITDQARSQAGEQASNATTKLSENLRSLAEEVRQLSQGNADANGTVAGLAQQLAGKGEELADYLSRQGPGGLVQELRSYAGRRPGGFLLAALAAGLTTGRVVKGATAGGSAGSSTPPLPATPVLPVQPAVPVGYVEPLPPVDVYPAAEPYAPLGTTGTHSGLGGELDDAFPPIHGEPIDDLTAGPPYAPGTGLR